MVWDEGDDIIKESERNSSRKEIRLGGSVEGWPFDSLPSEELSV